MTKPRYLLVFAALALTACVKKDDTPSCAHTGEIVTIKLDGRSGMVLGRNAYGIYKIRIPLNGDSRRAYANEWMYCYEFERGVE